MIMVDTAYHTVYMVESSMVNAGMNGRADSERYKRGGVRMTDGNSGMFNLQCQHALVMRREMMKSEKCENTSNQHQNHSA